MPRALQIDSHFPSSLYNPRFDDPISIHPEVLTHLIHPRLNPINSTLRTPFRVKPHI
jgi:hypothetical protein